MVSNVIATAYLILSLALSVFHMLKSGAKVTRTVLIILDMVILIFIRLRNRCFLFVKLIN